MQEFRSFAMRGNVVDMAIGVIMGASFGKIVSSLVNDVLMPPIGAVIGGVDFSNLSFTIHSLMDKPPVLIKYGVFINMILDFVIVAFCMFLVIKAINRLSKKNEIPPAAATTKECPECFMAIPVNARRCGHCTSAMK